jgi:NOL1/NOP2/fmu family ribosome biogenesis protein
MIPIKFFNEREKERVMKMLNQQFGIKEIPFVMARLGKERIIIFSGDLSERNILNIDEIAHIEGIGLYFAKEELEGIRLSIEGAQLMKYQITKNIFELNKEQSEQWMMGQDLNLKSEKRGFFVMKYKNDFLGTGKLSAEKISNFIPKSRRLKYKENKIIEE